MESLSSFQQQASLVSLWSTAQNRNVPKTPTPCFSLSISQFFIRIKLLSSFQPSFAFVFISVLGNVILSLLTFFTCQVDLKFLSCFLFVGLIAHPLNPFTLFILFFFYYNLFPSGYTGIVYINVCCHNAFTCVGCSSSAYLFSHPLGRSTSLTQL